MAKNVFETMDDSQDPPLALSAVELRVGGRELLRDVSFCLNPGEIVCLLGNNGAGKSTLFRCCAGLDGVASGTIRLLGREVLRLSDAARSRLVAWCPQALDRVSGFTSFQFVALAGELDRFLHGRGAISPAERELFRKSLDLFDAQGIAERDISVLSGGEWKRVQLARVWAQGAKVVILDEPGTGLDLRHVALLSQRIRERARDAGTAFLLSTHDLGLALSVSDRFVFIHGGTVKAQGTREELAGSAVFEEVFGVNFRWIREGGSTLALPDLSCSSGGA